MLQMFLRCLHNLRRPVVSLSSSYSTTVPEPQEVVHPREQWRRRQQFARPKIQRFEQPVVKQYYAPEWKFSDPTKDEEYIPHQGCITTPEKWEYYNKVVWPIGHVVPETGLPKPVEVFHCVENIHYSTRKMFYPCQFVWRLNVDEALRQLKFKHSKGALVLADALSEAKKRASDEFHIDDPSKMFVAEAFAIQSNIFKSRKRHARENWCITRHRYINLFIRLEEGEPPQYKSRLPVPDGWEKMKNYIEYLRNRELKYSI